MLVLLTKRKLRPDGCQTVKPPGILQCQIYFALHFSWENYWDWSTICRWPSPEFSKPLLFCSSCSPSYVIPFLGPGLDPLLPPLPFESCCPAGVGWGRFLSSRITRANLPWSCKGLSASLRLFVLCSKQTQSQAPWRIVHFGGSNLQLSIGCLVDLRAKSELKLLSEVWQCELELT